ncbi:phosphatase PAP2 family protein [Staphylococcus sp. SQ8-PEA]|uniref:Phosphatase PAP2 family protein n=1 Tax=Staphylococcus marylandisciuri TaxID=2981529 RepID=A0ABT2QNI6_9STAP|nr:phosphatase PAP2 family protein [Staphylococcus marylandisciuri]MCU5745526.1 phosphatase PAP2 family protein [Staphylococcus marylandisciuri]
MSRWKRISLLVLLIIFFIIFALYHGSTFGKWLDTNVYELLHSLYSAIVTTLFRVITSVGEVWSMAVLSCLLIGILVYKRYHAEALFFILAMALSTILNPLLKNIFDRERPDILRLVDVSGYSFPSGHAMGSMVFFGCLIYIVNRIFKGLTNKVMSTICACLIVLICASRIYLGVHFPTDILAGLCGGASCIILSTLVLRHKLKI